jgi:CBS domain-containing protein
VSERFYRQTSDSELAWRDGYGAGATRREDVMFDPDAPHALPLGIHPDDHRRGVGATADGYPAAGTYGRSAPAGGASSGRRWRRGSQLARDVMTRNPKGVRPTDTVQQVAQAMAEQDTGLVPVLDEQNTLLGVVTDRDIVCGLVARGVDLKTARAGEAMTDDVECVTERDTLADVLRVMSEHHVRRVPVVARGDRLVGVISMADIAREADVDAELQDAFDEIASERRFWSGLR